MVTTFKKMQGTHPAKYHKAENVLELIGTDPDLEKSITALRAEVDPAKRKELKDALPIVVWAGKFSKRGNANLTAHAGLLVLDFDKLEPDTLAALRAKVVADPHTFGAFTSPSGNGLKVVVRIEPRPTSNEEHAHAWQVVADHFGNDPDASGKNVERVCFLSFDPEVYINEGAAPLAIPTAQKPAMPTLNGIQGAELDAIAQRAMERVAAEIPLGDSDRPTVDPFPLHVLPHTLRWIVEQYHEALGWHPDYTAGSMLFALSVAMGDTRRIQPKRGWQEKGALWLVLVGPPGVGKTHPLEGMCEPLRDRDRGHFQDFTTAMAFHENELEDYAMQVRARRTKKGQAQGGEHPVKPTEPECRQHLVNDATPEALEGILAANPKGVGLCRDELAGWVGDYGRYTKSGEAEGYLSLWSGVPKRTDRKGKKGGSLPKSVFFSVAGTIQPGVLHKLGADGRNANGFMDRLLFIQPENPVVPPWTEHELADTAPQRWAEIVGRLLSLEGDPVALPLSPDAKTAWVVFFGDASERITTLNANGDHARAEKLAKQKSYALRLALVLEMAAWAESGEPTTPVTIGAAAMQGGIDLSRYFTKMAYRVQFDLHEAAPSDALKGHALRLFQAMPEEFSAAQAILEGQKLGISRRTVERALRDRKSYSRSKQRGQYAKRG